MEIKIKQILVGGITKLTTQKKITYKVKINQLKPINQLEIGQPLAQNPKSSQYSIRIMFPVKHRFCDKATAVI